MNEDFVYYLYFDLIVLIHIHSGVKIWKKCNLGNIACIFFSFLSHCNDSHRAQIRYKVEDDNNNSSIFMIKKNISCQISFTFVMFMILIYKFVKILTTSPMYYTHTPKVLLLLLYKFSSRAIIIIKSKG